MSQEKTKASWADEIDELDQEVESRTPTYEKEDFTIKRDDDRVESGEDRPRRRERNNRDREPREQREPLPFPDSPPFTAFVGNLPYDVYKDEIQKFFEDRGCKVQNVRLLMNKETNKPKGFGYVTFDELSDLKNAVSLTGQTLLDRPLRIDVAEARADDFVKPKRESKDRNFNRGGGRPRNYENKEREERPRIEILPRGSNSSITPTSSSEDMSDAYKSTKENPFGAARPRDENTIMKNLQERKNKEEVTSPTTTPKEGEDRDKSNKERPPRRDNNRGPRNDKGGPSSRGGRKFDDKEKFKNNKESRSNRDDKPRAPRPSELKSEQKTQMSRNMFEGLAEEDD